MSNQNLTGKENVIALMALYRQEWEYRDKNTNSLMWRFAYLSLITTFLPSVLEPLGVSHSTVAYIPLWVFSAAGLAFALLGLYISVGLIKRIEGIDRLYKQVVKKLPLDCQYQPLDKRPYDFIFMPRLSYVLCFSIFGIVGLLSFVNLCYTL